MTEQDFFRIWVMLHCKGDIKNFTPQDIIGAFLMLPTPSIDPKDWVNTMQQLGKPQELSEEEKIKLNGEVFNSFPADLKKKAKVTSGIEISEKK